MPPAMDRRQLVLENRELRAVAGKRDDIEARLPGRTQAMVDLRYRLRAVAGTDADLLIIGDTGTGKEVAARAIHDLSPRAAQPFVAINCAALPGSLIESELFGHEAGAFPGALRPRYGKFEHARGGTVLLDEIGSMPQDLQAKLLRVIQDRVITRLGSNEPVPLDVRFIALSKVDLEEEVATERFRAELLYRLNVVTLKMPPLAQRREDIPLLFLQLVREAAARYRRDDPQVAPQMLTDLSRTRLAGQCARTAQRCRPACSWPRSCGGEDGGRLGYVARVGRSRRQLRKIRDCRCAGRAWGTPKACL